MTSVTPYTVAKRDGSIVPFRQERILKALDAAFRDTYAIAAPTPITNDIAIAMQKVAVLVIQQALELASKKVSLTVEGLQDLVEVTLMKSGYHNVARDYIIYRDNHKKLRSDDPRNIMVLRGDQNSPARFNPIKVAATLELIFRHVHAVNGQTPSNLIHMVNRLTEKVIERVVEHHLMHQQLTTSNIQTMIEQVLMGSTYFEAAKSYILKQSEKLAAHEETALPQEKQPIKQKKSQKSFKVIKADGSETSVFESDLLEKLEFATRFYKEKIDVEEMLKATTLNFYEGMKESEVDTALIMASRAKIEQDPIYSNITAQLLLDTIYEEVLGVPASTPDLFAIHTNYFQKYIDKGIELKRISPELKKFDLEKLSKAMHLERDLKFQYLGLQTLYDRYFIHDKGTRMETPQIFWMRVAMGLSIKEEKKEERALEFYSVLSTLDYLSSTPTLFNAGTLHSQLSSCYLSTIMDNLEHIFKTISDDAQLSKWAGGLGNDWSNVRGTGARIKGTNGQSQGIVPFLKVANDTAVAVNQGGKRKGAMCAYLETWHIDIEDYLELRKNTGDERRRTHDMNTANWIPDLFMKRVAQNAQWTLFSPNEVPDLHSLYGAAFEKRYLEYEAMAENNQITLWKKVDSLLLWRKMLTMLFETGHPWITFKDPCNIRSPQDHVGVVHCSNLCTEITLNTSKEETAVCNLGSINLANHVTPEGLNTKKLQKTVTTAIRMLDNVIDINFYPIKEAKTSNSLHRPIGLGLMGFQDALNIQKFSYASHEAVQFADQSMEAISYFALLSSSHLAKERNPYPSYKGSKWERGILPIDSIDLLEKERGLPIKMNRETTMDWTLVREAIAKNGLRNSNVMAIAPTATIANIAGVTASIEPNYKNLYAKSNLSGEFTFINPHLVQALKEKDLWDEEMIDDLKYFDGSVLEIKRIPNELKQQFLTAFEINFEWIIECASRRQKWIDQAQSLNLFVDNPNGKKLNSMYFLAWEHGLKTTYYLRSQARTSIEKSTMDINKRELQPRWMKHASPSSRVDVGGKKREKPSVPVCNLEEGCESCQ
ncbi:ribonucleoside-diphosphate reductase subunit alpha [Candidatus Aerophobetes bacterium]|uniref:Ribonucleoside-diphosphate reductase n=1 Tax=Aerophobetes bacterium TaxID=2030807 RepID=A0A2A4X6J9_UNCAE|nr:MAG: ribonucleoside-diphosphate reductase subunit alpha [Candidatus Aerophobetes bacterium]